MKPIEYIGSQPKKKSSSNIFGGWVILLLALAMAGFFGMRFSDLVMAQGSQVTTAATDSTIVSLKSTGQFGNILAAEALERTKLDVTYDASYYSLSYPNGDVPADRGVCTDVVVRSYRSMGIDLQKVVHEDMKSHFRVYPQIWRAAGPDHSIDHRRVPNLQRFFSRKGKELQKTRDAADYEYGDVVSWFLASGQTHIGIVVPGPGDRADEKWIVHNIGAGPVWDDALFTHQVIGHYRYTGHK